MCFGGQQVATPGDVAEQASYITPSQNYPDNGMSGQKSAANQRRKSALAGGYDSQFAQGLANPAVTTRNLLG